jgi:selenophosphate synthase
MDITLQNYRAVNMATQLMNNPVVDITCDHQSSGPPAAAVGKNHAAANRAAVTPITVPKIKKEPTHPNSQKTLFSKP